MTRLSGSGIENFVWTRGEFELLGLVGPNHRELSTRLLHKRISAEEQLHIHEVIVDAGPSRHSARLADRLGGDRELERLLLRGEFGLLLGVILFVHDDDALPFDLVDLGESAALNVFLPAINGVIDVVGDDGPGLLRVLVDTCRDTLRNSRIASPPESSSC